MFKVYSMMLWFTYIVKAITTVGSDNNHLPSSHNKRNKRIKEKIFFLVIGSLRINSQLHYIS